MGDEGRNRYASLRCESEIVFLFANYRRWAFYTRTPSSTRDLSSTYPCRIQNAPMIKNTGIVTDERIDALKYYSIVSLTVIQIITYLRYRSNGNVNQDWQVHLCHCRVIIYLAGDL